MSNATISLHGRTGKPDIIGIAGPNGDALKTEVGAGNFFQILLGMIPQPGDNPSKTQVPVAQAGESGTLLPAGTDTSSHKKPGKLPGLKVVHGVFAPPADAQKVGDGSGTASPAQQVTDSGNQHSAVEPQIQASAAPAPPVQVVEPAGPAGTGNGKPQAIAPGIVTTEILKSLPGSTMSTPATPKDAKPLAATLMPPVQAEEIALGVQARSAGVPEEAASAPEAAKTDADQTGSNSPAQAGAVKQQAAGDAAAGIDTLKFLRVQAAVPLDVPAGLAAPVAKRPAAGDHLAPKAAEALSTDVPDALRSGVVKDGGTTDAKFILRAPGAEHPAASHPAPAVAALEGNEQVQNVNLRALAPMEQATVSIPEPSPFHSVGDQAKSHDTKGTDAHSSGQAEVSSLPQGSAVNAPADVHEMNDALLGKDASLQLHGGSPASKADVTESSPASVPSRLATLPPDLSHSVVEQVIKNLVVQPDGKVSEMHLTLKPESLGEVGLKVRMEEGKMQAQIDVTQPSVKAAIESSLPELRQALSLKGIDVQRIDIFAGPQSFSRESNGGQGDRPQKRGGKRGTEDDAVSQYGAVRDMGYNTIELYV